MEKYKNAVWEGRFQPIHLGHLAYIGELLKRAERVWIVMVNNETQTDRPYDKSPVPDFTQCVDQHHIPEKNPLPFWIRYLLLTETIKSEFGYDAPVTVMGGHRLDLDWKFYTTALPPNRVFLTPVRDAFEDVKAKAWSDLGEKNERIDISELPVISATDVRNSVKHNRDITGLLHKKTIELLNEHNAWKFI